LSRASSKTTKVPLVARESHGWTPSVWKKVQMPVPVMRISSDEDFDGEAILIRTILMHEKCSLLLSYIFGLDVFDVLALIEVALAAGKSRMKVDCHISCA